MSFYLKANLNIPIYLFYFQFREKDDVKPSMANAGKVISVVYIYL